MRYLSCFSISAALVCCLAASPVRASMAGADADDAGSSSGTLLAGFQDLTHLVEEGALVPESALTISETKSSGPTTAPSTSKGVDRTAASLTTLPAGADMHAGAGLFERASQSVSPSGSGDALPAAAPPIQLQGELNRYVGDPQVPSAEVTTMATSASSALDLSSANQTIATPTVPIPAAIFLLGGGRLGSWPLRRSARFSLRS
jgi:hypothetical protein